MLVELRDRFRFPELAAAHHRDAVGEVSAEESGDEVTGGVESEGGAGLEWGVSVAGDG